MTTARYVYWRDGNHWLGYFEEFPDYLTQGETLEDLQDHLRDLYSDLTSPAPLSLFRGIAKSATISQNISPKN